MRRSAILLALVSAVAFTPAAGVAAPEAGAKEKEKKICRKDVVTGSVMVKKTCRTKAEWDALAAKGQDEMNRMRDIDRNRSFTTQSR